MTNKIKQIVEDNFVETCLAIIDEGEFGLILPFDTRWSVSLQSNEITIAIVVSNWTYEQFKYDEVGVTIKTAAKDNKETVASFNWGEVLGITDVNLKPILIKCNTTIDKFTLKGMIK